MAEFDRGALQLTLYKEGSEACRNYSRLTMETRNGVQQVLGIGGLGTAAALIFSRTDAAPYILLIAGLAYMVFAISLTVVDWHYQSAFTAIRNSLATIEHDWGVKRTGPWTAHLAVRTHVKDHIASHLPFALVFECGAAAAALSFLGWKWDSNVRDIGLCLIAFAAPAWASFFVYMLQEATRSDKKIAHDLGVRVNQVEDKTWLQKLRMLYCSFKT